MRVTESRAPHEGAGSQPAAVVELRAAHVAPPSPSSPPAPAPAASAQPAPALPDAERPAEHGRGGAAGDIEPQTDRLRYLDTATRRIARGMDLDETLRELRLAAVPAFADTILVYLCDPLSVGDEKSAPPVTLRLHLPEPPLKPRPDAADTERLTVPGRLAELLLAGRPVFGDTQGIGSAVAELLEPVLSGAGSLPDGRRLIVAPLRGRHRVMGTVVLLRHPDRPAFIGDDLLVASQLATHTALGIDKAVLYGREASVADALQRAMLPSSLPEPTGVRLASRYLPASETARVGGDWYDAIPLPGNRVALVVGDVMGHSMTSAAIMGQLRTTVQTLAGLDLPPDEVLHHLDEQAQRLGSEHMATCLYAIYDPVSRRLLVANAGHPPPVLLHPDGRAEVLWVPPGAPIGVGGVAFEAVEMAAPAGATLLLYTDGLVESRDRDVWTGVELLRARLHAAAHVLAAPPLEELCDEVLDILGPGTRDDDIALLAARFDGIPSHDVAYWFLDPRPQTAGRARRLTARSLHRWGLESMLESTELMVSEVVTNAVRYATRPITLRLLRTDVLRCEVGDDSQKVPRMRQAQPGDEGGRGLFLVDRLAWRWGATRLSTGKVVWFEQQIPERYREKRLVPQPDGRP
ncbi:serine phosphatase RsbU (regulator of sigma subunit)/anti-sigma regulatory factor (Ser/Thr protein kinase) [Streptacidiphilus sp. MAP12-16]|uniref:SpoIIE family protein phosphatase n=1 Tax=Streptacidiphilus sp. MAP12-16 TaxID=3156300 RepID=UPI00351459C8